MIASALEERALPARGAGGRLLPASRGPRRARMAARAGRPERLGAVVRALSRPPVELRSVDVARLTQLARRRKLDMPSAVAAALEGPQLSEEGRDRARVFLRLYRSASNAFEDRRPDAFVLRLIERIGLRRQQVFATHADTSSGSATSRSCPSSPPPTCAASPRHGARLHPLPRRRGRVGPARGGGHRHAHRAGVQVMTMGAPAGSSSTTSSCSASRRPGCRARTARGGRDAERAAEGTPAGADSREAHETEMRRLLHLAMTRARKGLVLAWCLVRCPVPGAACARGSAPGTRHRTRQSKRAPGTAPGTKHRAPGTDRVRHSRNSL